MPLHALSNVRPVRITVCKQGANRQVWLLRKQDRPEEDELVSLGQPTLLVKSDWSVAYCVVAEPGAIEDGGQGTKDVEDQWADEDEIRKAAHFFMRNGDLSVGLHDSLSEYGGVVENAVALADFRVDTPNGSRTIKKGSWYVALEPNEQAKALIEAGEFNGISLEGTGVRTPVGKGVGRNAPVPRKCQSCGATLAKDQGACKSCGAKYVVKAADTSSKTLPPIPRKPGTNWVERVGGFPRNNWIYRTAKHLHFERGMDVSRAFAVAVNAAKKLCAGGDTNFPGKQSVDPAKRADACKAVAQWEAMKQRSHRQAVRKATLSAQSRKQLPGSAFALPGRRYPIHDESHARNALARVAQHGTSDEQKRVRGAVCRRFPKICEGMKKAAMDETTEKDVNEVLAGLSDEKPGLLAKVARAVGIKDEEIEPAQAFDKDPLAELVKQMQGDDDGLDLSAIDRFRSWAEAQDAEALEKTLSGDAGSIAGRSEEEADVGWTDEERERIEKLESSVNGLGPKLDELLKRDSAEDKPPTADEMKKQLDEFADATVGKLDELSKSLSTLADQGSTQPDDEIKKSNGQTPEGVIGLLR